MAIKRCLEAAPHPSKRRCPFRGALILSTATASAFDIASHATVSSTLTALAPEEALEQMGVKAHTMRFTIHVPLKGSALKIDERTASSESVLQQLANLLTQ